jgi:hypothetical protein
MQDCKPCNNSPMKMKLGEWVAGLQKMFTSLRVKTQTETTLHAIACWGQQR